jgi:hypothetical protein
MTKNSGGKTPSSSKPDGSQTPSSDPSTSPPTPEKKAAKNKKSAPAEVPPGLDEGKHRSAQVHAQAAEVIDHEIFPYFMAKALGLDDRLSIPVYQAFLAQKMSEMGDPKDPIERMLIEQICLAHFRIGALHAAAANAQNMTGIKILNAATARMLGEMRRTALSLRAYAGSAVPMKRKKAQVKLFKEAQ